MLVVHLPSDSVEALADRREYVLMLGAIGLRMGDVVLFWLRKLDADAIATALALVTMRLCHDDPTVQDGPA